MEPPEALAEAPNEALTGALTGVLTEAPIGTLTGALTGALTEPPIGALTEALTEASNYNYYIIIIKYFITIYP